MSSITLNLPDDIVAELVRAAQASNRSAEAVAEDLLKRMLMLRRFEQVRREVREALGPDAPQSEEEIFALIS